MKRLLELGGQGHLSEINQEIEEFTGDSLLGLTDWDAIVRRTIQENSSDTKSYRGKLDLFYSVEGLGKGIWGLREDDSEDSEGVNIVLLDDEEEFFPEGKKVARTHRSRERSTSLRNKKIDEYREQNNGVPCQVCGDDYSGIFCFEKALIDAHHLIPLSETSGSRKTGVDELAMVCPTCHRALHMSEDCSNLESLSKKIRDYRERH